MAIRAVGPEQSGFIIVCGFHSGCSGNNEKSNWNWREKSQNRQMSASGNAGKMFLRDFSFFFFTPQSSLSIIAPTSEGIRRYHISARGKSTSPPACAFNEIFD